MKALCSSVCGRLPAFDGQIRYQQRTSYMSRQYMYEKGRRISHTTCQVTEDGSITLSDYTSHFIPLTYTAFLNSSHSSFILLTNNFYSTCWEFITL